MNQPLSKYKSKVTIVVSKGGLKLCTSRHELCMLLRMRVIKQFQSLCMKIAPECYGSQFAPIRCVRQPAANLPILPIPPIIITSLHSPDVPDRLTWPQPVASLKKTTRGECMKHATLHIVCKQIILFLMQQVGEGVREVPFAWPGDPWLSLQPV